MCPTFPPCAILRRMKGRIGIITTLLAATGLLVALALTGCGLLGGSRAPGDAQVAAAVSDTDGLARVESAAGIIDFQVSSGLTGERLAGARLRVAVWGDSRMLYAEDPARQHLPVAVPLDGTPSVRRLVLPPLTAIGYNITTASGALNIADLSPLGTLSEADLRARLNAGPDEAVLIYLYNPNSPLALTGASLEAFAAPFDNVTVLRAAGEPPDAALSMVVVGVSHTLFNTWEHREIDRYLATRIGKRPDTDLRGDLAFRWSYPVYQVFPDGDVLQLAEDGTAKVIVSWLSANPNPPPPWSIFLTSNTEEAVTIEPESALLGPDTPSAEFLITVNREALPPGAHSVELYIQPFSETFGLIQQSITRTLDFEVADRPPTPTPGPQVEALALSPDNPSEGDTLYVEATGFTPREAVLVEMTGANFNFRDALATANDEGAFNYLFDLTTVPAGTYTITLTGTASQVQGLANVTIAEKLADAIVDRPELNLRLGPGEDYPVVEVLVQGDELSVISVNWDDSWIEVRTKTGQTGWVVTALVDLNVSLQDIPWNSNFPAPSGG